MSTELIDQLITDLDHDIEVLTERRRLAVELRATWSDEPAEPATEPEPPAKPAAKKKRAARRKKNIQKPCPECGELFHPNGLGPHRRAKHPKPALEVVKDDEPKTIVPNPSLMYRCSMCDFTDTTREELARHTVDVHHRGLRPEEHAARAEAVAS